MKRNRILAMLCAVSLCCMNFSISAPALAEAESPVEEVTIDLPVEKHAEAPAEKPAEAPAEKPAEAPAEKPAEAPAEKPAETPAEKPAEAPAEKPAETPAEKPAETPAEKPAETPAEKPAEEAAADTPVETPKEKETPAADDSGDEKPASENSGAPEDSGAEKENEEKKEEDGGSEPADSEPTAVPTAEPTAEPTEEPTAEPTEEPTAEPTAEPTVEPTAEPTVEPTVEPTEEPTLEPTPEPTPEPQVALTGFHASRKEAAPGETVEFGFEVENAESVIWSADRSDGYYGGSGRLEEGNSFTWTPSRTGIYTVTVNATGNGVTVSESCQVLVRSSALAVSVYTPQMYAVAGERQIQYNLTMTGGVEPYTVGIAVDFKGSRIFAATEFMSEVVCGAMGYGEHVLTLNVTDALGATASATGVILGSSEETNTPPSLPRLSKDMTFSERLVAVARSQVGYEESTVNFGYKQNGQVQGWSYYGHWCGLPYEEWCAMFVEYCLEKAGVGEGILARAANCNRWKRYVGKDYIDDEDDYIPEPGDLIFFHHDRVSDDPNFPNHIGIVVDYDPVLDMVYTVEGNSGKMVRERMYSRENARIVGYISLRRVMNRHDKVYKERLDKALADDMNARKNRSRDDNLLLTKGAAQ